ncbi:hypothetical protein RUND412_003841 [Rhizina undulata]
MSSIMGPIASWATFLTIVGGIYWIYFRKSPQPAVGQRTKRATPTVTEQPRTQSGKGGSNALTSGGSGTEATSAAADKKKKKKKKKAAPSNTSQKESVPVEENAEKAESSDDDVAQEVDQKEVAKRLQAMREGNTVAAAPKAPAPRTSRQATIQQANLAAPSTRSYAASQASSTGADGDIDEEFAVGLTSTSTDPSDMLGEESAGTRILSIKPSSQPPRQPKQKAVSTSPQPGAQASKNAKKNAKKKLEKEAERAEQKSRFEEHRASMRAVEATKQNTKPQAPAPTQASVWTNAGEEGSSSVATLAPAAPTSEEFLDTFNPADNSAGSQATPTDSEEDKRQMRSTHLDASVWEEIPPHLDSGWNEVSSKKTRKQKKQSDEQIGHSSDEAAAAIPAGLIPAPIAAPKKAAKQPTKPPKEAPRSGNGFQALDTFDSVSESKGSSSDWAEVDDPDHWAVHPEE